MNGMLHSRRERLRTSLCGAALLGLLLTSACLGVKVAEVHEVADVSLSAPRTQIERTELAQPELQVDVDAAGVTILGMLARQCTAVTVRDVDRTEITRRTVTYPTVSQRASFWAYGVGGLLLGGAGATLLASNTVPDELDRTGVEVGSAVAGAAGLIWTGTAVWASVSGIDRRQHLGAVAVELERHVGPCDHAPMAQALVSIGGVHGSLDAGGEAYWSWGELDDAELDSLRVGPTLVRLVDTEGSIRSMPMNAAATSALVFVAGAIHERRVDEAKRAQGQPDGFGTIPVQFRWPVSESETIAPGCCKICSKGKACGDTCISRSYTCHVGVGCACDAR